MPASSLVSALVGGGGENAATAIDPNVAAANSNIQLGQAMQEAGLSTAPGSPAQALGRLAQALSGTYLHSTGISDLGKAMSGSADALSKILPPNHFLQAGLHSNNPLALMTAINAVPAALKIGSDTQKLTPGEGSYYPGSSAPAAQNTGPQSGPGKEISDAEKLQAAGNPGAANAITAGVNKGALTPEGIPIPPIPLKPTNTAQPSAAIPPPTPDQMTAAKGKLAQNLTNVAQSGVTNPSPTGLVGDIVAAKGAQAQAEEAGKANVEYGSYRQPPGGPQSGPGISEPMPTNHGTQIPPVNAQATVPSDPGVLKEKLPAWQKTVTDWTSSIAPAQLAQQRLTTIANAFKSFESGSFTTQKADIAAGLKAVGLDATGVLGDPAQAQLALHENYAETMSQLKAATSRFTQQEFRITSENKEHPNIQPTANLQMLGEDMGTLQQQQDVANDWSAANKNGWKDPQSYETEYLKANPLPAYVARAKAAIGPLKGMPGATAAATAPVESPHSQAEIQAEMKRRGLIQ